MLLFLPFNKLFLQMKRNKRWSHLYTWLDELTRSFGPQSYISKALFAFRGLYFCSSNLADSIQGSYFTCVVYKGSQICCGEDSRFEPFPRQLTVDVAVAGFFFTAAKIFAGRATIHIIRHVGLSSSDLRNQPSKDSWAFIDEIYRRTSWLWWCL